MGKFEKAVLISSSIVLIPVVALGSIFAAPMVAYTLIVDTMDEREQMKLYTTRPYEYLRRRIGSYLDHLTPENLLEVHFDRLYTQFIKAASGLPDRVEQIIETERNKMGLIMDDTRSTELVLEMYRDMQVQIDVLYGSLQMISFQYKRDHVEIGYQNVLTDFVESTPENEDVVAKGTYATLYRCSKKPDLVLRVRHQALTNENARDQFEELKSIKSLQMLGNKVCSVLIFNSYIRLQNPPRLAMVFESCNCSLHYYLQINKDLVPGKVFELWVQNYAKRTPKSEYLDKCPSPEKSKLLDKDDDLPKKEIFIDSVESSIEKEPLLDRKEKSMTSDDCDGKVSPNYESIGSEELNDDKLTTSIKIEEPSLDMELLSAMLKALIFVFDIGIKMSYLMNGINDNKFVHRDLRTENILIVLKEEITTITIPISEADNNQLVLNMPNICLKICDITHEKQADKCILENPNARACLPPEVFSKTGGAFKSAEVFSFGALLWELYTLGSPVNDLKIDLETDSNGGATNMIFERSVKDEPTAVMSRRIFSFNPLKIFEHGESAENLNPECYRLFAMPVPPQLTSLISKCTAMHPENRPTMTECNEKLIKMQETLLEPDGLKQLFPQFFPQ